LILLDGSAQKLQNCLNNQDLSNPLRHDLNNVLFGIQTAKKIITDSFQL